MYLLLKFLFVGLAYTVAVLLSWVYLAPEALEGLPRTHLVAYVAFQANTVVLFTHGYIKKPKPVATDEYRNKEFYDYIRDDLYKFSLRKAKEGHEFSTPFEILLLAALHEAVESEKHFRKSGKSLSYIDTHKHHCLNNFLLITKKYEEHVTGKKDTATS